MKKFSILKLFIVLNYLKQFDAFDSNSSTVAAEFEILNQTLYHVGFSLIVDDFSKFEFKTGLVELHVCLKYNWWSDEYNETTKSSKSSPPSFIFDSNVEQVNKTLTHTNLNEFYMNKQRFKSRYLQNFEQNSTIKFKCSSFDQMDLYSSSFPFDSYICELNLQLTDLPIVTIKPLFNSSGIKNYNKLVKKSSEYSIFAREWILKNVDIAYIKQNSNESVLNKNQLVLKFCVRRRREPHVIMFICPLAIFTCITFLIFLIPTSVASEKTLLTFFNFMCLFVFNIYMFNLMFHSYEFIAMPFILQYSNCLMSLQLVVFIYICLSKSMHYYCCCKYRDTYRQLLGINMSPSVSSFNNTITTDSLPTKRIINDGTITISCGKIKQPPSEVFALETKNADSNEITLDKGRCRCNSMETDADCSNDLIESGHGIPASCINLSEHWDTKNNSPKTIQIKNNDFISNIEIQQKKIIITSIDRDSINGNWVLSKPSNDTKASKNCENRKTSRIYPCTNDQPEYDYGSHLARQGPTKSKRSLNIFDSKKAEPNLYNEINNNDTAELNFHLKSSLQISKINQNINRLINIEETNVKEKILHNQWERKARYVDGLCCLFVFFLLAACSILIFFILPCLDIIITKDIFRF